MPERPSIGKPNPALPALPNRPEMKRINLVCVTNRNPEEVEKEKP
ncbi:hypothetical protein Achl_3115 [Pseudarthrobacter chlorophenolicus A6]|uniref:Uncharacterized protein n=1 Tax=Pseudarthrobacter chlorophenolicus (strain ATCC 700700 / DSM 12829 / CIP 107037 / JCM 12360 / KCTC 9906 / NCIMB 13794 / A6) TaxID=452863 RepID=B8HFA8_PSECP|nr:hypothetical protein Achl_3115 [Pseudarthrobacter chlorophenolicus A6]